VFTATLRFYEELNDFLPGKVRKQDFSVSWPEARSVKDLIESLGVPHTEIDMILVNGESVGFDYKVQSGDRISVYPCFEAVDITSASKLGAPPLREPRFIADVHLGSLARLLRLLGLDCAYDGNIDDGEIIDISLRDRRIILTRDRRLLMRRVVNHGICIHSARAVDQAGEIISKIQLEKHIRPFTRCLLCNGVIENVEKDEILNRIPKVTASRVNEFGRCAGCGKIFWHGAHSKGLNRSIDAVMARLDRSENKGGG